MRLFYEAALAQRATILREEEPAGEIQSKLGRFIVGWVHYLS